MSRALDRLASFDRYSATAERASKQVIDAYSTSFGMATRLLGRRHRRHVRNIYALVRVADELVDGVASEAGLTPLQQHRALTALAEETASALTLGYSCNPVVHAFAGTARESGIDATLLDPFFSSMRADLPPLSENTSGPAAPSDGVVAFGFEAHRDYVHGSAEVVGLMCLRVFLRDEQQEPEQCHVLEHGARQLGAAFQNVNFLRDLADDTSRLGRSYLSPQGRLSEPELQRWVMTIRSQLADAASVLPLLPRDARTAVRSALGLFSALTDRIAATSPAELYERRVRLPAPAKAGILLRSVAGVPRVGRA